MPANQAESMVEALRRKGNPVVYFLVSANPMASEGPATFNDASMRN
jgi:hypothetical protein